MAEETNSKPKRNEKQKVHLVPNSQRTPEQIRANGRKGGLASARARKRNKLLRELLTEFLSLKVKPKAKELPPELVEIIAKAGLKDLTLKERGALMFAYQMSIGKLNPTLFVSKMIGEYDDSIQAVEVEVEQTEAQTPIIVQVSNQSEQTELNHLLEQQDNEGN